MADKAQPQTVVLIYEKGEVLNNDFFGGNFKGIESKLPYLQSLGITIIYLNQKKLGIDYLKMMKAENILLLHCSHFLQNWRRIIKSKTKLIKIPDKTYSHKYEGKTNIPNKNISIVFAALLFFTFIISLFK